MNEKIEIIKLEDVTPYLEKIEIIKLDDVTSYQAKIDCKDAEPWLWEEVSENGDEIFFIRVSDAIVGTAYIGDEAKAFVYVYIFPEYRNRGYGEAAAIAAEQMIKTTPLPLPRIRHKRGSRDRRLRENRPSCR